jgi:adenylate kinase family enzyme
MEHPRRIVMEQPRRILLLGAPGSGKGRLAPIIGQRLGLPVVRLDRNHGKEGRVARSDPRWREEVAALAADEFWVMTGQEAEMLDVCVPRADWVVWLDLAVGLCLRKTLQRLMRRSAEKVPAGADRPRSAHWSSLHIAWRFPALVVPAIVAMIQRERRNRTIFILHSEPEIAQFIDKLPQARV